MFSYFVVICVCLSLSFGAADENEARAQETQLVDDIANIILNDVMVVSRRVSAISTASSNVSAHIGTTVGSMSKVTQAKIEPRLKVLSALVADPKHAAINLSEVIQKTVMQKLEEKSKRAFNGRSFASRIVTGLAKSFVTAVLG